MSLKNGLVDSSKNARTSIDLNRGTGKTMNELVTIGYEGSSIDDFIATLKLAKIEILLDVREIPNSRKKGFSKKGLKNTLADAGIGYVHIPSLGDPKDGRDAARAGEHEKFKKIFNAHLKSPSARQGLREAAELASNARSCLLCFERAPEKCHRSIVAKKLSTISSLSILHIGVQRGAANDAGDRRRGRSLSVSEGATAG